MKYRNFAVATWSDDIVLSMSPEQKLIFIYLYTSPYTSSCGIFKISMRTAGFQLGYTNTPFESALKGLCAAFPDLVAYDEKTSEVALLQYPKQLLICATGKALAISQKEVEKVESQKLLMAMISKNSAGLSRPYLSQLRRLQMEKINGKNVNELLHGDVAQVTVYQEDSRKREIEIESKYILSFSSENDNASFSSKGDIQERTVGETFPAAPPRKAKKKAAPEVDDSIKSAIEEIVSYLNAKTGANYWTTTKTTVRAISDRIKEGYSIDDFKQVIDFKVSKWLGDEKMSEYLRPSTLFIPAHFNDYLNGSKITNAAANTDAALKDIPHIDSASAAQYGRFIDHVQEYYPSLWRSSCRVFSQSEYFDYMSNKTIPGVALNLTADEKREHLARIMKELSASESKRKQYGTVWQAYETTMRARLNGKNVEI